MHAQHCLTCVHGKLQDANFGLWIIGIISAAALLASAFIAFFEFFVSITNNAGRHTAGLSFPMGCGSILLLLVTSTRHPAEQICILL